MGDEVVGCRESFLDGSESWLGISVGVNVGAKVCFAVGSVVGVSVPQNEFNL